jgi:hypothetical protein
MIESKSLTKHSVLLMRGPKKGGGHHRKGTEGTASKFIDGSNTASQSNANFQTFSLSKRAFNNFNSLPKIKYNASRPASPPLEKPQSKNPFNLGSSNKNADLLFILKNFCNHDQLNKLVEKDKTLYKTFFVTEGREKSKPQKQAFFREPLKPDLKFEGKTTEAEQNSVYLSNQYHRKAKSSGIEKVPSGSLLRGHSNTNEINSFAKDFDRNSSKKLNFESRETFDEALDSKMNKNNVHFKVVDIVGDKYKQNMLQIKLKVQNVRIKGLYKKFKENLRIKKQEELMEKATYKRDKSKDLAQENYLNEVKRVTKIVGEGYKSLTNQMEEIVENVEREYAPSGKYT